MATKACPEDQQAETKPSKRFPDHGPIDLFAVGGSPGVPPIKHTGQAEYNGNPRHDALPLGNRRRSYLHGRITHGFAIVVFGLYQDSGGSFGVSFSAMPSYRYLLFIPQH
jgi:hypothetical protein